MPVIHALATSTIHAAATPTILTPPRPSIRAAASAPVGMLTAKAGVSTGDHLLGENSAHRRRGLGSVRAWLHAS